MMIKRPLRTLTLSLAAAAALLAQACGTTSRRPDEPVDRTLFREATERGQVMKHLEHLTTKIGARLTGSDNCIRACEWAKAQFESWGLKASLDEWNASADNPRFKVGFNRGPWSAKMIEPETLDLECTTPSWSPGTKGAQTGHAILAPADVEAAAALGDALKGAWVILKGARATGPVLAKCEELGALGFVRASAANDLIQGGGSPTRSWEEVPTRVHITLLHSQHKKIVGFLEDKKPVRLMFDLRNEFVKGPVKCYNVIADIVGTEKPDEYVVVGGHIDSWDGAQGCTDNGTGTSTTLEAARLLASIGARPKRTIRFMLWSGEEQGLLGSASWCRRNRDLMPKVSACFVHDMGTNYLSGLVVSESMKPVFEKICEPLMKVVPDSDDPFSKANAEFPFSLTIGNVGASGGGSDHMSFLQHGVPAFFWRQAGRVNYGRGWHTQHDKYEIAVPEYQQRSAYVIAIVALGVANLDEMITREGLRGGPPPPPRRLGVTTGSDEATVDTVADDSPAAKAGVKPGDKILRLDGKPAHTTEVRRSAVASAPRQTTIVVLRDGQELELKLEFPGPARQEPPPAQDPPPRLGVQHEDDATLTAVIPDTPAAAAGLKEGDRIIQVGDRKVTTGDELRAAITAAPRETTVTFIRDGKEQSVKVTFAR